MVQLPEDEMQACDGSEASQVPTLAPKPYILDPRRSSEVAAQ